MEALGANIFVVVVVVLSDTPLFNDLIQFDAYKNLNNLHLSRRLTN